MPLTILKNKNFISVLATTISITEKKIVEKLELISYIWYFITFKE